MSHGVRVARARAQRGRFFSRRARAERSRLRAAVAMGPYGARPGSPKAATVLAQAGSPKPVGASSFRRGKTVLDTFQSGSDYRKFSADIVGYRT